MLASCLGRINIIVQLRATLAEKAVLTSIALLHLHRTICIVSFRFYLQGNQDTLLAWPQRSGIN